MPVNHAALATEVNTDPRGYGYAEDVAVGNDQAVADKLNLVRDGSVGRVPANPTGDGGSADGVVLVKRADVTSREVIEAVDLADFPALPSNPNASALSTERRQLAYLGWLASVSTMRLVGDDGNDLPIVGNLGAMFPAGTGSRNRLLALRRRPGSRAEELFGVSVTASDVAKALRP